MSLESCLCWDISTVRLRSLIISFVNENYVGQPVHSCSLFAAKKSIRHPILAIFCVAEQCSLS